MSWLAERKIKWRYRMADGSIKHLELPASEDAPSEWEGGSLAGFEPEVVEQTTVVEYDKNGRKAVQIRRKDGKVIHQSKSKLNWMKTGRIENKYTKEYEEHLLKTQQEQLLRTEHNRKRARVSKMDPKDLLKNMPDGEYISDGNTVTAAPPGIADGKVKPPKKG